MSERTKTTLEVRAEIGDIMTKLAVLDNKLEDTLEQAVQGTHSLGAGFTGAGNQAIAGGTMMANGSNQAMTAVTGLNWAISDMPYFFQNTRMGIMAVSNNITPLVQNMAYLQKTTGSLKGTLAAMGSVFTGPMGVVFAITAAISVIQSLSFIMAKNKEKTEGSTEANKKFAESLDKILQSTDIDYLRDQIDTAKQLKKISIDRVNELKKEKRKYEELGEAISLLKKGAKNSMLIAPFKGLLALNKAKEDARLLVENFKKAHPEVEVTKDNIKGIISGLGAEINQNHVLIGQQNAQIQLSKKQIDYNEDKGKKSKDEVQYEKKKEEFRISQLETEEQIAEYQAKYLVLEAELLALSNNEKAKTEDILQKKNEILDVEKQLYTLNLKTKNEDNGELTRAIKTAEASKLAYQKAQEEYDLFLQGIDTSSDRYLNNQLERIKTEMDATADGTKEKAELQTQYYNTLAELTANKEEQAKALQEAELEYQRRIASSLADGDLEGLYEQVFGNIKQQLLQFALDRLGITRAMMNMEKLMKEKSLKLT